MSISNFLFVLLSLWISSSFGNKVRFVNDCEFTVTVSAHNSSVLIATQLNYAQISGFFDVQNVTTFSFEITSTLSATPSPFGITISGTGNFYTVVVMNSTTGVAISTTSESMTANNSQSFIQLANLIPNSTVSLSPILKDGSIPSAFFQEFGFNSFSPFVGFNASTLSGFALTVSPGSPINVTATLVPNVLYTIFAFRGLSSNPNFATLVLDRSFLPPSNESFNSTSNNTVATSGVLNATLTTSVTSSAVSTTSVATSSTTSFATSGSVTSGSTTSFLTTNPSTSTTTSGSENNDANRNYAAMSSLVFCVIALNFILV